MVISKKISIVIFLLFTFISSLLYFTSCGIPQVLPTLNIPIAEYSSATIEDSSEFENKSITFTCTNDESYFQGYYFFYRDSSNFLNQASFCYFDQDLHEWVFIDSIPSSNEIDEFKTFKNFQFTFYFNNIFYPESSNTSGTIRDTYLIVQKDNKNNLSELYAKGKSLTIYLIPIGKDIKGPYIYTPAFSTSSNRVIFNFK
jgi:hypothetical protein